MARFTASILDCIAVYSRSESSTDNAFVPVLSPPPPQPWSFIRFLDGRTANDLPINCRPSSRDIARRADSMVVYSTNA